MNDSILKAIGDTPLIRLQSISKKAVVLAKFEFLNPGSIKDRMAYHMVKVAEKQGKLKKGFTIIEATTGNTGIALAILSATLGYKMIAVMPEGMSSEKQTIIKALGGRVILTPYKSGPKGAIEKRDELAKDIMNSWVPDQFANKENIIAHDKTTGKEIVKQTQGKVDIFVAGVGTGGTLMGVGNALKRVNREIKVVAVEPMESAVLSGEKAGEHGIAGIGEGFIPPLVDLNKISQIVKVSTEEAKEMSRYLAKKEGILAGVSSGANMAAVLKLEARMKKETVIVTVLPDRGERYLSTDLFK